MSTSTRTCELLAMQVALVSACIGCSKDSLEFSEPRAVSAATTVGTAPMFAIGPDGSEAVAWISAAQGGTDGRLYISVNGAAPAELRDSLGPIEAHGESPPKIVYGPDGTLHAIYVVGQVLPDQRFPLAALRHVASRDGGKTWSSPARVTDDGDFGSHNFHALHVARNGRVYVAWLDGRAGKSGAYTAWSDDGGATWSANTRVSVGEACPCCRTAIASDTGQIVYLAWRAVLPGNIRDVVVARSVDGGSTWSSPERVHADGWVYEGCPHAGPSMAVDEKHRLHVTWWTGKEGAAGVFYARADDGVKFGPATAIAAAPRSRPSHVQLALSGDRVAVTWDDGFSRTPSVKVRLSRDGGTSFDGAVTVSDPALVSTFPVLAISKSELTLAWSAEDTTSHRRAEAAKPDMSDPKAKKGLTPVGSANVIARKAKLDPR
jgi:hypothetical protein